MQATAIPYRYTDSEQKQLLDSLTVLIDTREQANRHITDYLTSKNIEYKEKALSYGDYSFYLPADPGLGIAKDVYFDKQLVIERKANLEELSCCFTKDRSRFENELIRSNGSRFVLLVEHGTYSDIVNSEYTTQYNAKSFVATLFSFIHRYNMQVAFIPGRLSGNYIYHACYYFLREWLK